jgi:hypothetical protein
MDKTCRTFGREQFIGNFKKNKSLETPRHRRMVKMDVKGI